MANKGTEDYLLSIVYHQRTCLFNYCRILVKERVFYDAMKMKLHFTTIITELIVDNLAAINSKFLESTPSLNMPHVGNGVRFHR